MNDENELIHETSPYLLQHAHNPVHWKAWNEHTLALAQKENKPILISIGYAACHWCHVMEKETFEDKEAADLMNRNFICVKVDREERPDVDQVYMTAAQLINGNGGWPLNAFALPDGRPFYAATYFPRDRWMNLLEYFIQQFKEDREFLQSQAESISKGIHDINRRFFPGITSAFSSGELKRIRENVLDKIDPVFGGIRGKMKFPMASVWELLLELYVNEKDENILKATEQTLLHMANGGINDHLGGGFARYATDEKWMIPHFEKMLYDNAQLISLYSHAFQVTQNPVYKKVVEETIDFVLKELKAPKGYYASLDADSNGKEGEYYVWSYREISEALGEESSGFIDAFGITPGGNFDEAKNVLYRVSSDSWGDSGFDRSRSALLKIRNKRKRPALDDKVLTSWNAMMSVAFADAGCAFQNDIWIEKAKEILDFLLTDLLGSNNELYRNYQKGTASTHAFLDDYAFLIKALIRYYQVTFEISYLDKAKELTVYILEHYYHPEIKMCFYNDKRFQGIFTRLIESTDDVIPSSNAVMAENLFMLCTLYDEADWIKIATDMVKNVREDLVTQPVYYSSWARLMIRFVKPPYEVAIAGQKAPEMIKAFRQYFLPECVFCGDVEKANLSLLEDKFQQGKSWIYVCSNRVCQLPVATVSEALDQILKHRKQ